MTLLSIDFETYWDVDYTLSKMTTEAYVRDPRFEVIGVSVSVDQKPPVWLEEAQFRAFIGMLMASSAEVCCTAHHAHFDGLILSHHYGFRPKRWLCTLQMSRGINGNRIGNGLEALLVHHGLRPKGDNRSTKGKHRADFTPEEWREYGDYCDNDVVGHQNILRIYLPKFSADELDLQDMTIRMFTEPVLVMNEAVLADCLAYEQARKLELLHQNGLIASLEPNDAELEAAKKALGSAPRFAALLEAQGIEVPMKLNGKGDKLIHAFAKTDPEFQELLEHPDEDVRLLCEARQAIKSTLNETRTVRMLKMGAGGRACPVYIKIYGAHTLRWAGADGVNWQNFERTNKKNPRKGMIRQAVCAPPGFKVCVADSAQIQARLNAWLAGQGDLVRQFAEKVDVYSAFASEAYRRPIDRKHVAEDEIPGHVGKTCVLGLGFGMAWYKLAMEFMKGAQGGPPVQFGREDLAKLGVDPSRFLANPKTIERIKAMPSRLGISDRLVHCAVTNYFVEIYRQKNRHIVALWEFAERIIQRMHDKKYGPCFYLGIMEVCEEGIRGPDGTVLHYPHIQYREGRGVDGGFSYLSGRNKRTKLYGGLFVENIIQYLERVIMGRFMLRLNREHLQGRLGGRGRIAWTSHDEVTAVVPADDAPETYATMLRLLNDPPAWAPGLPLSAEGGFGDVYGAIK
jgi:DNA polymerase bacteriophage-type